MQILESTLVFSAATVTIGGKLVALNDSPDEQLLAVDLALPALRFDTVDGIVRLSVKRIGAAVWLKPDGLWSYAIVLTSATDRHGQPVVDSAGIGQALAHWAKGQTTGQHGRAPAERGGSQVIGYASVTIAGAGSAALKVEPPLLATPLPAASDAALLVRMLVSPGGTVEFAPAIQFGG